MKNAWMVAAMIAAGTAAAAQTQPEGPKQTVTVCLNVFGAPAGLAFRAQFIASKIYSQIGVDLQWRREETCPSGALVVDLRQRTPEKFQPGALAYALPYEGTHICVFLDRILNHYKPIDWWLVLGHVLAHEITHALEGVARHSETGLMKATWTHLDVCEMEYRLLALAPEDEQLVHLGLQVRAARNLVASAKDAAARRETEEELARPLRGAPSAQPIFGVVRDSEVAATVLREFLKSSERSTDGTVVAMR